jgi:hypothetical protein
VRNEDGGFGRRFGTGQWSMRLLAVVVVALPLMGCGSPARGSAVLVSPELAAADTVYAYSFIVTNLDVSTPDHHPATPADQRPRPRHTPRRGTHPAPTARRGPARAGPRPHPSPPHHALTRPKPAPTSPGTRTPGAILGPPARPRTNPTRSDSASTNSKINSLPTHGFGSDGMGMPPQRLCVVHTGISEAISGWMS